MHLVATLRQLAQGGRAILTTIHQPSSRLYQMLDKLLLLSEGYITLLLMLLFTDTSASCLGVTACKACNFSSLEQWCCCCAAVAVALTFILLLLPLHIACCCCCCCPHYKSSFSMGVSHAPQHTWLLSLQWVLLIPNCSRRACMH